MRTASESLESFDLVLAQFVDIHGTPKAKVVPREAFGSFAEEGVGFAGAALVGMGQQPSDPDFVARPDLASFTPLFPDARVARYACDLFVDGEPLPACSRSALRRGMDRLRERGWDLQVGAEPEFFILRRDDDGRLEPAFADDRLAKPCYDSRSLLANLPVVRELIHEMNRLGWGVYQTDHEDGNGQFEINFAYSGALETADRYIAFKMLAADVAARHGLIVTHMAKPFANRSGSGLHFHFNLADCETKTNLFLSSSDPRNLGNSELAYHFLGGVLHHAAALTAIVSPTVNCYKRLSIEGSDSGYTWTPACASYGGNNRTHMIRTPGPGRFEWRTVSAACNPYLALAAMIAAGLDGIDRRLDPGDPVHENMYEHTPDELRRRKFELLPANLSTALDALERDEVVLEGLGPAVAREFLRVKRGEWREYHRQVTTWEIDQYLLR